jgi:hypothetical protein
MLGEVTDQASVSFSLILFTELWPLDFNRKFQEIKSIPNSVFTLELQHRSHLRRLLFYRTTICNILLNACLQMVRVMVLNATLNIISVI